MSRSRFTLAFDHNNMVPAPDGKSTVQQIFADEDGKMITFGTSVPSDGTSGYEIGCLFIHTDGSALGTLYVNEGSETSCDFNAVTTAYADSVSSTMIADSAVTEARLGSAVSSGITTGPLAAKVIASTELEALLDTSENNLFAVKAGDEILKVELVVESAAGSSCTVDIGTDAAVDGTTKDPNGFIESGDANSAGHYASDDVTYDGADLRDGSFTVQGDGNITITSNSDQSSSSFVGKIVMTYIPA